MCSWLPWRSSLLVSVSESPEPMAPPPLPTLGSSATSVLGLPAFTPHMGSVPALASDGLGMPATALSHYLVFPALYLADRPGITQREEINQLQEEMALTLDSYIKGQQPQPRDRYGGSPGAWSSHQGLEGLLSLGEAFFNPFFFGKPSPLGYSPSL